MSRGRNFEAQNPTSLTAQAKQRDLALDVLRVGAILLVFCFHFPKFQGEPVFGAVARFGWMGVDLFFVLSGYLIGAQILNALQRDDFSFKRFYRSRFLRTLPIYLSVLTVYFLWPDFRERPEMSPLWKFLTFTQNFDLGSSAFSHAWSLSIEEQFYLICPALLLGAWQMRRRSVSFGLFVILLFAGLVYRHFAWTAFSALSQPQTKWDLYLRWIYFPTWGRLDGLTIGVGIAAVRTLLPSVWAKAGAMRTWIFTAGALVVAAAVLLFVDRLSWAATVFGFPLLSFGFGLILIAVARSGAGVSKMPAPVAYGVARKAVSGLAILSYSFYLIHKQVIHAVIENLPVANSRAEHLALGGLSFCASTIAALFMYQLIEKPFLKLRMRFER